MIPMLPLLLSFLGYISLSSAAPLNDGLATSQTLALFDYEKLVMSPETLVALSKEDAELFRSGGEDWLNDKNNATQGCKVFPGDTEWPSLSQWQLLDTSTAGGLLHPQPVSSVCYNRTQAQNTTACQSVTDNWNDLRWHTENALELLSPFYEGNTCLPPTIYDSGTCRQGGYSSYVVNVSSVRDVQLAINFARNTGVRLVIKNTGHDFNGKSAGAGSLSIWMHNLKDMEFVASYKSAAGSYTGPAIKAGAGVQVEDLYAFAYNPLSPLFGMAADQALEFQVVLANGSFVTANEVQNSDLFWALRGGGGGSYGVVTSVVIKVHPDIPVSTANLTISTVDQGVSKEAFWSALEAFLSYFPQWADDGLYTFFFIWNDVPSAGEFTLDIAPWLASNKTLQELQGYLKPWLSELKDLNVSTLPIWDQFPDFYTTWLTTGRETMQPPNQAVASRLWPRENFNDAKLFNSTFDTIRATVEAGYKTFGYNIAPTLTRGDNADDAVTPAWRDTVSHMMSGVNWPLYASSPDINNAWDDFEVYMNRWRKLSPEAGAYLNEADRREPDWQTSFWGDHYPRLLEIKKRYDPYDLFYAHHAVGSEGWEVRSIDGLPNENGRLCRMSE
ncbi:FAD-linked oxidoreductase ZEB1 [Pseudocercospora fuligena]|uniref:FAD-linked oxidoreductase ZEB1 n=1 Tax=Pseudocercospora fuligena TaxID=685502 RepID=A0A8H6RS99_9PEZI|nr:FAD-linked oxidoreductase ZEB1 [Pseudocercospora fuligena]